MESKIKEIFAKIPGDILEIRKWKYSISVRFAHEGNTFIPMFWEVNNINFDKKEVVYYILIRDFEYYTN